MKPVKRYVLGVLVALPFWGTAQAQLAVFDASTFQQSVMQVMAWSKQAAQMASQIQQLQSQYNALTGNRGFAAIFNNPALQNYLPANWQQVYTSIQSGGYQGLTSAAQALRSASTLYNCQTQTGSGWTSTDTNVCNRSLSKSYQDKAFVQQAYQDALDRTTQIQNLIQQISVTQDPKSIAELQARIAGEQAAINNEQTKLELFKHATEIENKLIQQQMHEDDMLRASSKIRASDNLTPVTFN